jgi:hypothetical protein
MTMMKQNLALPVAPEAKPATAPVAPRTGYTAPQLFAVGQTVELIQGGYRTGRWETRGSWYARW